MNVKRHGFTLVEIIVAIAVMLILAATITPSVLGILDKERVEKGYAALKHLAAGILEFKRDVTKNPSLLSQLSVYGITTNSNNSCGARFSAGEVSKYDGPYINRIPQPPAGLPVEIGLARDQLRRDPATSAAAGSPGVLQIVVDNVSESDAMALNDQVDGDNSSTAGTVRWEAPANGYVVLLYTVSISGC